MVRLKKAWDGESLHVASLCMKRYENMSILRTPTTKIRNDIFVKLG